MGFAGLEIGLVNHYPQANMVQCTKVFWELPAVSLRESTRASEFPLRVVPFFGTPIFPPNSFGRPHSLRSQTETCLVFQSRSSIAQEHADYALETSDGFLPCFPPVVFFFLHMEITMLMGSSQSPHSNG